MNKLTLMLYVWALWMYNMRWEISSPSRNRALRADDGRPMKYLLWRLAVTKNHFNLFNVFRFVNFSFNESKYSLHNNWKSPASSIKIKPNYNKLNWRKWNVENGRIDTDANISLASLHTLYSLWLMTRMLLTDCYY